ncbi:IclR family transcriptional regulator domain-containing protein [Hydrogenophaga sp. BPS33]|uniref:IclR family transcriptional regulator domain-containing protein n=1 Tax=Hydrogenophaga sp. BPS33 TaxID=2651974 RepID=UPI00131F60E5|nr:IclR family transcriptional regulator C-terminal domain-containing protein [Hydrogenophaga sp. BPS33]QHE85978.1 helix-turn-helix domain-containing protein [Hydrogenophaga sp. BPS33]
MKDDPIRAVQRVLNLLRLMNEREVWSLQALQERTGLPKSTLHRLLSTLQAEHCVYSGPEMAGRYRLTQSVTELSRGVTQKNRLADVARPIVIAATRDSKWPMAMGVIDGPVVRANVCSMPYSPYSMKPTSIGQAYDLLSTALGNAYLAFCDRKERRILIDLLNQQDCGLARWNAPALRQMMRNARQRGHTQRNGQRNDESSAIAVPVRSRSGQLLGVLACSTFSRSMSPSWLARMVPVAKATARDIGEAFGPD